MSCRVYLSGAEKRKKAAKLNEAISSVPQLTSFFAPIPSQSHISSQKEELEEVDTECTSHDEGECREIMQTEGEPDPPLINSADPSLNVPVISDDPVKWTVDEDMHEALVS